MACSACFLGSFGGSPLPHAQLRNYFLCQTKAYRQSLAKRKRILVRCVDERKHPEGEPSQLDGELKDILDLSMQGNATDANATKESDRRVMDGITETGVKEIEGIADEVKGDLEDLQRTVEENAAKLIEEETQTVLEKYNQKRQELLDNLQKDRDIISNEMERITELAETIENRKSMYKPKTLRETVYFLICSVFAVSTLYFAWKGLTEADPVALKNAAIDAAVAAACTLAFSLEKRRK